MVLAKHRYSVVRHRRAPMSGVIHGTWLIMTRGSVSVLAMTITTLSTGDKNADSVIEEVVWIHIFERISNNFLFIWDNFPVLSLSSQKL